MLESVISVLTSQLQNNGVEESKVQSVTSQINPGNLGQMATMLPMLLGGLNLSQDKIGAIIGNVMKDGFQISDITDGLMGNAQKAGDAISNTITDAKDAVTEKVEESKNPLDMAKDMLGNMFK